MSMISEFVEDLRYLERRERETGDTSHYAQWFNSAADTIEELSAKLSASQMERSSQYYHGGWIPCEERMPEEHDSIFAKLYGTDKWDSVMWRKLSDSVLVTIEFKDGTRKTEKMNTHDGEWFYDNSAIKFKVIAWRPLPEPHREVRDETD